MVYSVNQPIGIDASPDIKELGRMNSSEPFDHSPRGRRLESAKVSTGHGTIGSLPKRSESWIYSKYLPYVWRKMVSIPDSKPVSGTSARMSIDKLDPVELLSLPA